MEKPHGVSFEDGSPDTKWEKGTTSGRELSSCGSASGPTSSTNTSVGGRIEEKMEVDDPLLLPSLASLPSSSSITITKASVAQQRPSQSPSSSSTPCSTTAHVPSSHPSVSRTLPSTSSCDPISSANRAVLGPDMMPTIPLVPVQVPCGRGSIVSLPKIRGRPKGMPLSPSRGGNIHIRRGMKIRRIGLRGRGGRRLSHSMSLEERGGLIGEDSPLPLDDDAYVQDDMLMASTYQDRWDQLHGLDSLVRNKAPSKPGRVCSLCCLGEQSQLGQGDLVRHDPTPGYILPEKIASPSESSLQESLLSKKLKATQVSLKDKGKSPRKQVGGILPEPVDEISLVGHTELPSISLLFEPTGHCYAHYMCALWSSSVELTNDDTITHVDRAVVAGASQRCVQCKKFGATLLCKATGCQLQYHFPCAMSAGALMDLKSVALVCPAHTDKSRDIVDVACVVCENLSPESSLLFCCSCGNHYHGLCLKPVISPTPIMRAGWQCPDCKTCQMCRQPSEEMVCGVCDKAYHVMCARPFGLSLCRTGWKCKTCRVCGDCGSRTPGNGLSSRWHSNFTVCDSCYQLRNKGFACPICHKAYRAIAQKSMAMCTKCQRHVHSMCDADADLSIIQAKWNADHSYEYVCTSCSNIIPSPNQSPRTTLEDSCDGPQDSSINSDDSNDTDLTSEGKSEDLPTVKPQSSFLSKGKPLSLAKRGFPSKLRGGAGEKYSVGKKTFSGSKKRGQTIPVRRGRGNGRGYRGYFNYQNVTLQAMETHQSAGKEEGEENKLILVSAKDEFCLQQDVCAMCGAFGQDQEGRLIACAQCGQCYHPFCANVKVTKVVLQKGWRCLDCTVCEGCGERNDEARLVLCEDCDISYHIYCMNPPLDHVPSGVWRCKWCAICIHCGATDPGTNSTWQQNYSMCGPCMSMTQCPVCDEPYSDGELILQCSNCERWLHASDDMIHTEEEAERCASKGYLCLICRPQDAQPPHLLPHTPPIRSARIITTTVVTTTSTSPVRSQSPTDIMTKVTSKAQFWMDGICLSECGMSQIKNMTLEPQKKTSITHNRNPKTVRTSRGPSIDSTGSRDIDEDDDEDDENKLDTEEPRHWVYGMKEGTILPAKEDGTPPDLPEGFYTLPGLEPGTYTLRKRRYRNIKTLGIGGFQVRARGKKDEEKAREEALLDPQVLELRRKRSNWRTKKKIKLLEKFPSYIQEAFFGRNLMDTSNLEEEMKQISGLDEEIDEDVLEMQKAKSAITLSKDELQLVQAAQNKQQHGHDRLLDTCLQDTKYLAPHQIKSEDVGDIKKRERKDTDDKKDREHKDEDMEEDENNEAIDAIFAEGGDITDFFMHDIISGSMKDDDANLTGDEDISQDTIDIPSGSGSGTKLTDILGPGFNLDDVADIMKNLPEDGAEDSQDSTLSTTIPQAASLGAVEGEGSVCADSERSISSTPTESPATQTSSNLSVSKESLVAPTPSVPITLPAASTLRPNQPPVAPLGSLPLSGSTCGTVPPVQTVSGVSSVPPPSAPVSLSNAIQGPSPIPSIKSPATLPSPIGLASPVTHPNTSALPSTHPSPTTGVPSAPQTLSSPLPRPDSQTPSHGFCPTPTTFSSASKPPTPTIPEPQKLWSSNDSQSQSLSLEEDESLGDKATKAAVLYVNVHKPNLKTDFPAVADRERQIKRIWKNLKDTEQKKKLIQRARENKKEYYKNKQEQQRALKSNENLESSGTSGTNSSGNEGNNEPSPVTTPHASPRPPLPSLTPTRPMVITQRPQMPSGTPSRQAVPHNMIRGPINHPQGGSSETYTTPVGTSLPTKPMDSFTHPSTPTPQTSPLPSPTSDPYSRIPPSPRPPSDVYNLPPGTPRPVATDPFAMPPPTPRSVDPYAAQPPTPRPMTSEQFTCSTPTESPYVQAPPTPRPHDDIYGQPPTPTTPGVPGDPARQQHLRDLLQRPPWSEGSGVHAGVVPQPMTSPTGLSGEFRPPLPPAAQIANVRMRPNIAPGQSAMMIPQGGQMDHRFRMVFQRNLQQQPPQRQGAVNGRSSVDAFSHVSQQRPPQQYLGAAGPGVRPGLTNVQQQSESELPEAVTRELEQLEEEQQQQQQQHPAPQPPPQPGAPTHSSAQGDDLEDLAPSDLTNMEDDDLLGMGGDFNALLEFADGEDGEEDNEKLPSNLFDDLDADEEERRKKEKGREVVSGPRGPPKGKVGVPGVGSPSAGPLSHPQSTVAPSQGPQHHTTGSVTLDCDAQPQGPHPAPAINSSVQQRPGLSPGPTVGPVRLSMTTSPQQQPVQPQMAPQITQTTPRIASVVTRMLGPRTGLRQPAAPPPPYPGHPPPPYPRSQEQPLLIEDLLEQEKLEQMKQQKASHQQEPIGPVDLNLSDMEYEKLKADVLSVGNPPVGLPSVPGGQVLSNNGVRQPFQRVAGAPPPTSTQSPHQVPGPAQPMTRPVRPQGDPGMHPALLQAVGSRGTGSSTPGTVNIKTLPPPPLPPDNPQTDAERQQQSQYEHWLKQQHNLITTQQRYYEAEITKLRKQRKNLNSRLRTLKKNGQGLNEHDAAELARVQREASAIQRHLEQCRKSARQHAMIMQEYNNKKRNRPSHIMNTQGGVMNTSQGTMMTGTSPVGPAGSSPMHSTPQSPLMSPSPSSQPGMGLSPMVPSPHTPVASPNPTIVPQHSPHAMVVPGPHPSPGESPFSPQTRMPSPGGGYPDQGPRAAYSGTSQGMTHHMMAPQMRVRMPVHSPGTQTVQPSQISPHMMGVRSPYPQAGVIMPQGQGAPMMMRHQYPQGVMPLRRPSGSGPVPSPGSSGPIPSPGGPVQSPISGGMAMKPSPVHSGLKSPVPLASPSPGGPVASPVSGSMAMKPSPVHSGLRSPVPLASPQMQPLSSENPSTPLTPRSISAGEIIGTPQTPHSDLGGPGSNNSQVNSPHPSIPTPTSDAVPSPVSCSASSTSASVASGTPAVQRSGGGGNANNPNNPAPLPPYIRFGYFKLGLKGGAILRSRWGHFKLGLKGGSPVGDLENKPLTSTSCSEGAASPSTNTTAIVSSVTSSVVTSTPTSIKTESEGDEDKEGLAHVLSESVKGPPVRMMGGTSRVGTVAYPTPGIATTSMPPHLPVTANKLVVPEPAKSEIPPSSRHQAVIGIPGGGAIPSQNNIYPSHTVAVAPGIRIPSINASANYPSSTTGAGSVTTSTNMLNIPIGTSGSIASNLVPPSIMSVTSSATPTSSSYNTNVVPVGVPPDDVSTHSSIVSISDQVSGITSGLANFPSTASLPLSSVSAMTHTTPSLGRPLVSVPVQQIGSPQRPLLHNPVTTTNSQQLRTLPSIGHLQPGTRPFRTQVMGTTVSQPGVQDSEGHHVVSQPQVMHPTLTQTVGMLTNNVHQPVGQQTWIQTSSGTLHQGGVVIQGGVQQAVGVRMVAQPMMVQQTVVRGSNVMVRPCTSGPVAVQGGVRMMMIHGQPVRTPSPPVTRPAMMPPPAAKSPAGHSASPVPRVSPAPSPLLNHPSPHSPQIKGHSPSMTSPALSPHNTLPTPPSLIKREPDDDHPGSCSTPNITHPIPVATSTPQALGSQHMIVTGVSLQSQLSVMNPQVTTQNSETSGQIKSEVVNDDMSKDSSNALLKQLLENTGCANPMQQPSQGQLLLFRSSQGPVSVQSSHLSQVASQVPTPIVIPRSAVTSSGAVSHAPVQQTTSTPALVSQNNDMQQLQQHSQQPQPQPQSQHGVITPGSQPQSLGSNSHMMQRSVVVSTGVHSSPQGTHTVILGQQQQLVTHSGTHVNLGHSVARPGVPFVSQGHPVQFNTASHPSSQQGVVRQVTTHQVNHPGMIPSSVHHVIQGQPPHQTVAVSHSSHPVGGHPVTPAAPHMVVHPGVRATHPGQQHTMGNVHQPGTHIITGPRAPMSTPPTPASMTDRVNSDPGLKTEMRVMIPETVMGTGTSTGEHTPEMTTPNDGSDSLDHEELKKAKKRAQQARRKSQSKDAKVQPAKRARQGSRVEEDYDAYIESVMQQLRSMPPLTIMEPEVPRNFNLCPVFGSGDLSKLGRRDYNHSQGILEGTEGNATIKNVTDHYNTQPFGDKMPIVTPAKTGPTQRGFYIHEFTPPKIGLPLDEYQEGDLVGGSSRSTPAQTPTREADSPDTVLSSSSPECILPESPLPFKGLKLVDMDEDPQEDQRDRSLSPAIPLLIPVPIRPGRFSFLSTQNKENKDNPELDKENIDSLSSITMKSRIGQSPALPLKDMGNVTVTLTLSSQAGEDVSGVLRSLANLLNIPPPSAFHLADRLEAPKIPRLYRHKQLKDGKEQVVDIQSILNGQARFCRHCDVIILNDMLCKKVMELPFLNKEEYGNVEEVTFCSQQCYIQFALSQRMLMDEKVKHEGTSRHIKVKDTFGDMKGSSLPPAGGLSDWSKDDDMDEVLKVPQLEDSLVRRPNKHKLVDDHNQYPKQADGKRFRGHKYKYWTPTALTLPENYEKPTPKEMTDLLFRMGITYRKPRLRDDSRQCILCNLYGDYVADGPSRLLNYDVDKWIHLNCALWAEDVYETMNGALMNVEAAVKKVASSECEHCQQPGASVKCFKVRCSKVYHLNCAVKEGCTFYKNKTVYCQEHINKGEKDNELLTLSVFRRVFIDREENRQVASVMHHADLSYVLRIGSLILLAIGQLLPHQLQAFHTPYCIYPVGYQVIRYYWSMRRLHKRCAYECSIHDKDGQPEFRIIVKEDGYEDHAFVSCSPKGVWTKVLEPLAELRQKADVVRLFPQYISGEDLFGLTEPAIVRILESLPGIDTLADYNFKFGRNPLFELPLAVNPSGCARAEPFTKLHLKRYHGIRTSAGSVRTSSNCRAAASVANLTMAYDPFVPYSKLHVHSRSSQYKKMNNEWRSSVYLARSKIQGLGLYAARDIEKNTMIIEYIGEIIRSELAEVREKRYEAQNRGIYMFRLDDQRVVDATVTGGLARYINHSCGPNCYTETIEVERDMKILIISNRKILRGEELAYDYKFDEEEDHKIPCLCGAENCRKWMN